ncbi:MAG TPA: prephenate dehydratase [Syntrophomonas sp.]|jgi:prephenate dehydratase|nr:prephenate dehydratase [Syntrophomonas sp.]
MAYAVLGPHGTFSEEAANRYWGHRDDIMVATSIPQVFALVESGRVDEALVPLENSLAGTVKATIQCLRNSQLTIKGEILLPIRQDLLGGRKYELGEIELLISQPIALMQCQTFVSRHLPGVRTEICDSTSQAALTICQESRKAVSIGNRQAANIYGLEIIYPDIAEEGNATRFIHIGREKKETFRDKASIIFALPDRAGALYEVLGVFAQRSLNLSKIESYPGQNVGAGYYFYIEVDTPTGEDLQPVLYELQGLCSYIKYLGSYRRAG